MSFDILDLYTWLLAFLCLVLVLKKGDGEGWEIEDEFDVEMERGGIVEKGIENHERSKVQLM
jgi:hypothetical protein